MPTKETEEKTILSERLKELLNLKYLTRAKLDPYNANKYLLKDIWHNNKKSGIHKLGWNNPLDIPYYPRGDSFRGPTSGGRYNKECLEVGKSAVEYDFNEAYTVLLKTYPLPSNVLVTNAKFDTEKIIKRLKDYDKPRPYKDLKTFIFVDFYMEAIPKANTYTGKEKSGSMFLMYKEGIAQQMTLTEIELKLLFDFFDVKEFKVMNTYTFRMRESMLDDYFERLEPLRNDEIAGKAYKTMRNKIYGQISATEYKGADEKIFNFPMYNRAIGAFVAGVFRDRMARLEQQYVNDENYKLLMIKTDALYFDKEVPYFEALVKRGIMKKINVTLTENDVTGLNVRG